MEKFDCSAKGKTVYISRELKSASALEDYSKKYIPGQITYSDNDYHCSNLKCPLLQMRYRKILMIQENSFV